MKLTKILLVVVSQPMKLTKILLVVVSQSLKVAKMLAIPQQVQSAADSWLNYSPLAAIRVVTLAMQAKK